jgi:hypothetical protein
MRIEQGECLFCSSEGAVAAESDAEICHMCARKALIAFLARLHGETDPDELEKLKEAGRAVVADTKRKLKDFRDATTDEEVASATEALFPQ